VNSEFTRFVLAGGFAALFNIFSRLAFSMVMPFEAAVVLAYLVGMATAFALTRRFVFERSQRHIAHEMARFTLVNLLALAQVWLVSVGLADWLFPRIGLTWNADLVAHIVGVMSPIGTSFLGHKRFTFGSPRKI